jgi:protein required for attachment to host cells
VVCRGAGVQRQIDPADRDQTRNTAERQDCNKDEKVKAMLTGSTLVVVADGAVARFLSRTRPGLRLVEMPDRHMLIDAVEPERDRPARTHDRMGAGRHAMESRLSAHEIAEARFLSRVAERTIELVRSENPSRLVLCAPPRALGTLRAALSSDARERLTLSWSKDITKETPAEIDERLKELKV